jgi:2-polyprenyl-3-methyl-5-hydroxy-6-metoxy-1,4-benzoquinol methylase
LANIGFKNLSGINPYIAKDLRIDSIRIFKKHIYEIDEPFDFIMLYHSYEHMFKLAEILLDLKRIISPNGKIIIRIPVADSFAWRT